MKAEDGLEKPESDSGHVSESDEVSDYVVNKKTGEIQPYKEEIVWGNVLKFTILHASFFYSLTYLPVLSLKMWIFTFLTIQFSGAGITMGAHRL